MKNLLSKFVTDQNTGKLLEEFLSTMGDDRGTVKFTYDDEGAVDSLFLVSTKTKKKFVDLDLLSIQLDTTFNIEEGRYKLVAFCYHDVQCNKTEVAALAIISAEEDKNFTFIFTEFKNLNDKDVVSVLIDVNICI